MKGIILAGGTGSRLRPITLATSKQLIPLFDKPMIYYSLSVLMLSEIRDILIITTEYDLDNYKKLFGNGDRLGMNIDYCIQKNPNGIGEAFILGEEFIANESVCLILGDNFFYGPSLRLKLLEAKDNKHGATIFGYQVTNPSSFGVVEFDEQLNVKSIIEKPKNPRSNFAVTGLYYYDNDVVEIAKSIKPSKRGELEITSINNAYLNKNKLSIQLLERGFAWLDTGTSSNLLRASSFVESVQTNQGYLIACLEEIALKNGWICQDDLKAIISDYSNTEYGQYLESLT
jgi:glucose-1-phosphate thymidylyltransferase